MAEQDTPPPTITAMKIPIIKKGEYDIWSMRMRQYICHTDHNLWDIIVDGDLQEEPAPTRDQSGPSAPLIPKTVKQLAAKRNQEREAIKSRFRGNEESKKMQKNALKHQFENLTTAPNEIMDMAYDRFQKLISQLEVYAAPVSKEDINQKFLRSLPPSWSQIALIMRNKPDIDQTDIDDLYNNLRVYEDEMKRSLSFTSNSQNLAFLSFENTSRSNEVSTASGDFRVSIAGGSSQVSSTPCADEVMCSFFAQQTTSPQLENEDLQQIDEDDLEELDLRWQVAMLTVRVKKFIQKTGNNLDFKGKQPVRLDKSKVECYNCHRKWHFARECNSGRNQGKRPYGDNGRRNASTNEPSSQALIAKWEDFISKNLDELLNSKMSARDKTGLGYGTQLNEMSDKSETDSEISMSVFEVRSSDEESTPVNDRFSKADGYHVVPPPITGNFLTPRADISFAGLDEYAIRKKIIKSKTTELNADTSKSKTSETVGNTNEVNVEKPKSVNESVVSTPNINKDKVIIEDWNSDDENDVSEVSPVKTNETQTAKTQVDKIGQTSKKAGIGFKKIKACFVCKSTDHLIKDCDFYDKKSPEPKLKNVVNTGQRVVKPVWDNAKRVNHQKISNKLNYPQERRTFVPSGVLTRTGLVNPVRSNEKRAVQTINTAKPFAPKIAQTSSDVRPIYLKMDNVRPRASYSPIKRSYYTKLAFRPKNLKQDVQTFEVQNMTTAGTRALVNTGKGNMDTDLKKSRWVWRPKGNYLDHVSKYNGYFMLKKGNPKILLQDHAVVDSGCSSHMTGNKAYLLDYEDYNGGFVAFGSDPKGGKITGKGKIRTANLDFDDVYFVDELKFNLFSVSQMCDKKNSVLFTETECLILSPSFKLLDKSQVVLRAPRKDDVYSLDLKNIVPSGGITCLYANATADESKLWHRRLGHVNFKNINKLVKGHLVRGLPSKVFVNDHTCVACKKGKQHKASCKAKLERIIRKPLELLHMDLFGPVSVESINKKRCDNGTEFKNHAMNELCAKKGIKREFSKSPSISFMRPFGCPLTILNTLDSLGKFDGKSDEGYLLGYSTSSKAFRVYNKRTKRIEENLHIDFLEDQPNVAGIGPNWMFDLDFLTNIMNYIPVSVENQVNVDAGTQDSYVAGSLGKDKGPTQEYILLLLHPHSTRIPVEDVAPAAHEKPSESSPKDNDVQDLENVADKEGQHQMIEDEQVLHDELEKMIAQEVVAKALDDATRQAFEEEKRNIASQKRATQANKLSIGRLSVSTATTPYVSAASTPIGANAGESSFVYLGGKISIDASTLPNVDLPIDLNMPDLEDDSDAFSNDGICNGAYKDENVGAVDNFNNMDDTINVSPIPTLRIHKDYLKDQILGDPKSAVQTRGKIQKASLAQQALVSFISKQNRTNHKDHQNYLLACFLSHEEPKNISQALQDKSWVEAMQEELLQFKLQKVWILVDLPSRKKAIGTKWVFKN
ncbi:ribonuclease H-like domain-containing protein, partial [Tanacetum coccineum]